MGRVAVLASGNGSNFQAICDDLRGGPHQVAGLISDQEGAFALTRASRMGIPTKVVDYGRTARDRSAAEMRIAGILNDWNPDLIALAGFMRILSSEFVGMFARTLINIHPSLLPRHPGLNAIERSYESGEQVVGITVHFVDDGVDTGEVIRQETLVRGKGETLAELEARIHTLEHSTYPQVIRSLLENMAPAAEAMLK